MEEAAEKINDIAAVMENAGINSSIASSNETEIMIEPRLPLTPEERYME
jgi:hypothetical protein